MREECGVIIVAGGSGTRMGGRELKQFRLLHNRPVFLWSARFFAAQNSVNEIVLVVPEHELERASVLYERHGVGGRSKIVAGGERRQDSVAAGLAAFSNAPTMVAIHDAARPFPPQNFDAAVMRASERNGVIFALPVGDTLKKVDKQSIRGTVGREKLWAAQTPQIFRRELIEGTEAAFGIRIASPERKSR